LTNSFVCSELISHEVGPVTCNLLLAIYSYSLIVIRLAAALGVGLAMVDADERDWFAELSETPC